MPSITIPITPHMGPLLAASVGVSIPRQMALMAEKLPVPAHRQGRFLIDTGASGTCVDAGLIAKLGLVPTGLVDLHTPSTNGTAHPCNQYDVALFIPGPAGKSGCLIEAVGVMETNLASQGIDGLIGRDLLDRWTCIYNGTDATLTICY